MRDAETRLQAGPATNATATREVWLAAIPLARLINATFFVLTSAYCLLTYNAFAYRQFIKPRLVGWLTDFVAWNHVAYWLMLVVTAWTMRCELGERPGRARWIGWSYLALSTAVGVALVARPVLPQVENDWSGLLFALAALVPPVWLAIYDHAQTSGQVTVTSSSPLRVFRAGLLAGTLTWLVYSLWVPWRLDRTVDITLSAGDVAFGLATSALVHLVGGSAVAVAAVLVIGAVRRRSIDARLEYVVVALTSWAVVACACYRIVFAALAFSGRVAALVAASVGCVIVLTWSGIARRTTAHRASVTAVDAWLSPLPGIRSRAGSAVGFGIMVAAAFWSISAVEGIDWDFLVQKMIVAAFWAGAVGYAYGLLGSMSDLMTWRSVATPPVLAAALFLGEARLEPRLPAQATHFVPEFVLEGYVALDPSFRLLQDLLRVGSAEDEAFYRYLRANSTVQDAHLTPVSVDFVPAVHPSPERKPNIFLFVIDSLRRDYLSPYDRRVTFTPAIDRFAKESVVFDRAFTRYGGTGLSVPAMWSGGMVFHKQYVTPFAPMNALMKLLDGEGYRRAMSMDSIVAQLLPRDESLIELDRQTEVMEYDFCRTLAELRATLATEATGNRPIFSYTLPQNLHISRVRFQSVPSTPYPGFYPQVASQIQRLDGCFGSFVDDLKAKRLYDESIIIITADHGDMLGEFRRWGHSYAMFPEIVRVPLIVHLPPRLQARYVSDPDRVALTTDITPTLYTLLGQNPADLGPLFGRSLFRDRSAPDPSRADEPRLLASSYGPVYAVLRDNGRRLYVADGVNDREYGYDLTAETPLRIGVTPADREQNRRLIRQQVDELARLYQFHPAS